MLELPPSCTLAELPARLGSRVIVWATGSAAQSLQLQLPWPVQTGPQVPLTTDAEWLLVAGGGTMIDRAKVARLAQPGLKLAALPTLWGSGAEVSPIAVLNEGVTKVIRVGSEVRPDLWVQAPALGASVPPALARFAAGDAWSHALEGFLSPLASETLREDLAQVITQMSALPLAYHRDWFELSALACAGQAMSSVGLVHGIAHTLEGRLRESQPDAGWSHARLCSLFLLPVMRFNAANPGGKWALLLARHQVEEAPLWPVLTALFSAEDYARARPLLTAHWRSVLRDACSRTNVALVRPDDLKFFEEFTPA